MKLRVTRTILWFLAGCGLTILALRLLHGPGSVTALTNAIPWGLWKGGGVVALVALGGAGFTLAMFVYIFGWKRYQPLIGGAVLLALMAYSSVAFGLSMDIGIWWRIVFPVFHWQLDSVLFEVAWCIMLYLIVLAGEFSHTVFERLGWQRPLRTLQRVTMVLVVAGISLSSLHQSSLGTLFLATPFRLHPLWYSPLLPLLFFVSAMAVGCLAITLLTLIVYWLHDAAPPMKALAGLGQIAAALLAVYLVMRFVEIAVAGKLPLLFTGGFETADFWIEIVLSAALPVALLLRRSLRESPRAMFRIALSACVGFTLNRINVAGLATLSLERTFYIPTWTEWALTLGILSAAGLFYLWAVERFGLFPGIPRAAVEASPSRLFGPGRLAEPRLYSLVFVLAASLALGCVSDDALYGVQPELAPVARPGVERVVRQARDEVPGASLLRYDIPDAPGPRVAALRIDGNRDGREVLFDHEAHIRRAGGGVEACGTCHHMNRPQDLASSCADCHRDMYDPVDIFDHDRHEEALGGNAGCVRCHVDAALPKRRENTTPCASCHPEMRVLGSRIEARRPPDRAPGTLATGYADAMHGLCVKCHEEKEAERPGPGGWLSGCTACHATMPREPLAARAPVLPGQGAPR